jgi:uncharacterized protein (DUF58 family)
MLSSKGFSFLSGSFLTLLSSAILFPYPPLVLLSLFLFFTSAFHVITLHSSYLSKIRPEDFIVHTAVSNTFSTVEKEIRVEVEVIYKGGRRVFCEIENSRSDALTIKGKAHWAGVLDASQSSIRISYSVSTPTRGVYDLGPVLIRATDEHDLCLKEMKSGPIYELVFIPRIKKTRAILKGSKAASLLFHEGSAPNRFAGLEEDFAEVRKYTLGDRMKHIDWKAVARSGTDDLYVRTFERRKQADVLLVLSGNPLERVHDRLVEAATSFAESFIDAGDRVGLLTSGPHVVSIAPAGGKVHLRNVMRGISEAAYSSDAEPALRELSKLLVRTRRFTTVILFGWPEKEIFEALVDAYKIYRNRVIILTPTFSSTAKLLGVTDPEARLEKVDATWENSVLEGFLEGVLVVMASVENLEGSLVQALKLLERRREFAA